VETSTTPCAAVRKAYSSTCSPSEEARTANPWLWLVISTTPSARRSTGWFTPRCPKVSL
jgi:hypothetical protein